MGMGEGLQTCVLRLSRPGTCSLRPWERPLTALFHQHSGDVLEREQLVNDAEEVFVNNMEHRMQMDKALHRMMMVFGPMVLSSSF
jgi:hypothetical protein